MQYNLPNPLCIVHKTSIFGTLAANIEPLLISNCATFQYNGPMLHTKSNSGILGLLVPLYSGEGRSVGRLALQRLLLLRIIVTVMSSIGLIVFQLLSPIEVPILLILSLIACILLSVVLGFWRLRASWAITNTELFSHLLLDVLFLIILLFYTGGAGNPLISYLLVLLAVGATLLTQFYVNVFALGSIAIYSFFILLELQSDSGASEDVVGFQLHLVGMWVIFVVSAILITLFVTNMAKAIRERESNLAKARETEMLNEQLVAIGTLAAGTAHALGTPLSTMAVLLTELNKQSPEELKNSEIKADISLLKEQVGRCKNSLNQLIRYYHKENEDREEKVQLTTYVNDIKDYIINIHPSASVEFMVDSNANPNISSNLSVKHAIINIIENGIKASTNHVDVLFKWVEGEQKHFEIAVNDDGPGIPTEVMENMGEPFKSSRKDSMGLGIFLANAAIQKLGGTIEMFNLKMGGALTLIKLPASTVS
ncbi:MAG: hypothetical protein CMQ17_11300 [Gammaproteobacteria bacterium]|nr:hypothetical protein [Gammaproteobacteria bacterium]